MTATAMSHEAELQPRTRALRNKVPEVTIWFWVIKILCTTVGESLADWINETLGFGLLNTTLLFTGVLVAALGWQISRREYQPFPYWFTVVALSVSGTLYTDILTDHLNVRLVVSTSAFAALLVVVFGIWFVRERTLSIHSITTLPREAFYWLAILVTFSLGTAAGDWTLDLTGWAPGVAVLLPSALIAAVLIGWRLGANPVLAFWIAYILTRPLGANMGDYFGLPKVDGGLGIGTAGTSFIFLGAILATVVYLAVSRRDVAKGDSTPAFRAPQPAREHALLGYFAVVLAATVGVLAYANAQPHGIAAASEADAPTPAEVAAAGGSVTTVPLPVLMPAQTTSAFPAADVASFRTIAQGARADVEAGNQAAALKAARSLEVAWDKDQAKLQPLDGTAWTVLDTKIDGVLTSIRAKAPNAATETTNIDALLAALG